MFIPSLSTFTEAEKITIGARLATGANLTGLIAGTLLETAAGWRPVEKLMQGDEVYTYDGGLRGIGRLERRFVDAAEAAPDGLVHVPGGILSNSEDLLVLPDQKLLIETAAHGGVGTLVRAADLAGQGGIAWKRELGPIQIVRPVFDDEEVLWANAGLLFHCAAATDKQGFFPRAMSDDLAAIRSAVCAAGVAEVCQAA